MTDETQKRPPGAWSGPTGKTTYAIASDLSCVVETDDGFGSFATELEAQTVLVGRCEGEKVRAAELLGKARRRLTYLRKLTEDNI